MPHNKNKISVVRQPWAARFSSSLFLCQQKGEIVLRINPSRQPLSFKERNMTSNQLERLKRDERELGHYLARLRKEGKIMLAHNIQKKKEYLQSRIIDIEEEYFLAS